MAKPLDGFRLVLTTADSEELARRLARALVEARLAACVNIVAPVTSVYRWKDEVSVDQEWLLLIKTRGERFEALSRTIHELHSYDVPEIVALDLENGDPVYLKWLAASVEPQATD
jgi:periplasmic divalent cation tolerance protein